MTDFSADRGQRGADPLGVLIPPPPRDKLDAFAAKVPTDLHEALGLTPYLGKDRTNGRARPVARRPIWT